MALCIITLVVGVAIVIASLFLTDGKKDNEEETVLDNSKEKLEKQLDSYCNSLVEKKKNELKKQGDEVKNNMKKGLDEMKNSSKKELEEMKKSTKKDMDAMRQESKKELDQMKADSSKEFDQLKAESQKELEQLKEQAGQDIKASSSNNTEEKSELDESALEKVKLVAGQVIDERIEELSKAAESAKPAETTGSAGEEASNVDKAAIQSELSELMENASRDISSMETDTKQRIELALKDYRDSIELAKESMKKELEDCEKQLSEKAKKQMIDYINKSLLEAYEAYDPDDDSEKERITYDEPAEGTQPETAQQPAEAQAENTQQPAEAQPENAQQPAGAQSENAQQPAEAQPENAQQPAGAQSENAQQSAEAQQESTQQPAEAQSEGTQQPSDKAQADNSKNEAGIQNAEGVQSTDNDYVTEVLTRDDTAQSSDIDSAFPVVEKESKPVGAENKSTKAASRNNRSKKKKKKKNDTVKNIDIWDEAVDIETQVADLHKKGLSIMEIANKLGIGVGEAKVMIDKVSGKN